MASSQEQLFHELMWRTQARGRRLPLPWWVQQYFRTWSDHYDGGLFPSREAAFASNALYRYWNMVAVKDRHQECLIGQSGEVEPVYDEYALSFFVFDPTTRRLFYPQYPDFSVSPAPLRQQWEDNYIPVLVTTWECAAGVRVTQKVLATTVAADQKDLVLARFHLNSSGSAGLPVWFCLAVTPVGPTGFRRQDRAREGVGDRSIRFLRYQPAKQQLEINRIWGPLFDKAPDSFGVYGNGGPADPDFYLQFNAYEELAARGALNGWATATDYSGGYCHAAFAWRADPSAADFTLDVRLPIGDFRSEGDLDVLRSEPAADLENGNRKFWTAKLNDSGATMTLPGPVSHLFDSFRTCRATLLMLSDDGEIHPGPTIYDSFWIRDSAIEGIACALAGDVNLPERQFGTHYLRRDVFHQEDGFIAGTQISRRGFFGMEHEIQDREWDSNGQALWALARFDRIKGSGYGFGSAVLAPFLAEGARWLRDNRSEFGLLHSGWSAEHLGAKDKPHYWDDFWALAGLWETAQLATRLGAPQSAELWGIYDELRRATSESILWVLDQQRRNGQWETFIPTGPADVGALDSTMIGTVAYFHPCRLHMGEKLGRDVDQAARLTLETIWSHFVDGGFRHDSAWRAYGPYLTLQLAHAFLYAGDIQHMDQLLGWTVGHAGYARIHASPGDASQWSVVQGVWNEQHCYPIAEDFSSSVPDWWYMGDIPHGWAAAELMLLLRDMMFFEADEDADPHVYIAPGVPPHWLNGNETVEIRNAPTTFGMPFGYRLVHDITAKAVTITVMDALAPHIRYIHPFRLGRPTSVLADGVNVPVESLDIHLPGGFHEAVITYAGP